MALGSGDLHSRCTWVGSIEDQKWQCRSHLIGWLNVVMGSVVIPRRPKNMPEAVCSVDNIYISDIYISDFQAAKAS